MFRKTIKINEEKCNGCGACAAACHEGAIQMIDGKAKLTREDYCDGLGDCLPACPTNAISFEEREAPAYNEEAVKAAEANAALNGLENCEFIAGDVFEVLKTVEDKPDVIVVDPPRAGISSDALDKIISYGVDQIVYISCNPKTLVENLYYLQYYGYRIVSVKPFDNFPGTKHTECVALLARECQ